MYYLEHGLKQKWLGVLFAIFGAFAAFGIGNGTQSKAVADVVHNTFDVPHWITGIALVIFGALVILGGIKSIGRVTAFFVPIMALFYFIAGAIVMVMNIELIPGAFATIFTFAFTGEAACRRRNRCRYPFRGRTWSLLQRSRAWICSDRRSSCKNGHAGTSGTNFDDTSIIRYTCHLFDHRC